MVAGVTTEELVQRFPFLYHMAQAGSWPSIRDHGLLSTSALLDLFEIRGEERDRIESHHRPESVPIVHRRYGEAVIRDQKPMSDAGLIRALQDGLTPTDWYRILNARVFFWLRSERLQRLLDARAYRDLRQTILTLDTKLLVERHHDRITLSPINSGCTKPLPWPRGKETFQRIPVYDFEARKKKQDPIVELAVDYSVPDLNEIVVEVNEVGGGEADRLLWKRA